MNIHEVTPDHLSPHWWIGKLSMAVAVAPKHPKVAQDTLEEFLRSGYPTKTLHDQLREELKK